MTFKIDSQIRGGKNHINITRTGHRYPNPAWAAWRDSVVLCLKSQKGPGCPLDKPCRVKIHYMAGDKRKRDVPALVDAIFHCLERAGIVTDDFLLQDLEWLTMYQPQNPGALIEITEKI